MRLPVEEIGIGTQYVVMTSAEEMKKAQDDAKSGYRPDTEKNNYSLRRKRRLPDHEIPTLLMSGHSKWDTTVSQVTLASIKSNLGWFGRNSIAATTNREWFAPRGQFPIDGRGTHPA